MPRVIVEIASEKTWPEDLGEKRALYAQLGVREYFVFDPEARYLDPPLQGFRRKGKRYEVLTPAADGSLASKELGLRLRAESAMVRLRDARTGQPLLTRQERAEQAQLQLAQERCRAGACRKGTRTPTRRYPGGRVGPPQGCQTFPEEELNPRSFPSPSDATAPDEAPSEAEGPLAPSPLTAPTRKGTVIVRLTGGGHRHLG